MSSTGFSAGVLRSGDTSGGIVDHRLARRMLINQIRLGRLRADEVCDAHPELLRAAANVGAVTEVTCPVCEQDQLRLVTYVFGRGLPSHGRCVSTAEEMQKLSRHGTERRAYVVEACVSCRWHHLLRVHQL